jgi:DNA-binding XRE family transcriptional regulator
MTTLESLGRHVQKKRGARGIREVAKEIGISHSTLSRVEQGHLPDLENYERICKWLGTKVIPMRKQPPSVAVPQVHFRKQKTISQESAHALAQMILSAQAALQQESGE